MSILIMSGNMRTAMDAHDIYCAMLTWPPRDIDHSVDIVISIRNIRGGKKIQLYSNSDDKCYVYLMKHTNPNYAICKNILKISLNNAVEIKLEYLRARAHCFIQAVTLVGE